MANAGMSDVQQELDSVRQVLATERAQLARVRAELEQAESSGNDRRLLQEENLELLRLISKLQDEENRLSSLLGECS